MFWLAYLFTVIVGGTFAVILRILRKVLGVGGKREPGTGHRNDNLEVVAMKILCDHLAFPFFEFVCGGVVFPIWSWF